MRLYFWYLREDSDDVVSLGWKGLCFCVSFCIVLWLLSFVLIMIQLIDHDIYFQVNAVLFIPMWLGSILGILTCFYVSTNVCKNSTLVTRERRDYMTTSGTVSELEFIDYDSLHLLKKLFCVSLVTGISFMCALISQVIYYFWFIGMFENLWTAINPILVLLILYQIYMYSMSFFSYFTCAVFSLLLLQLILYVMKVSEELDWSWIVVSIPVTIVFLLFFTHLVGLYFGIFSGKLRPTSIQFISLILLSIGCFLALLSLYFVGYDSIRLQLGLHFYSQCFNKYPKVLWTIAIVLITVGEVIVLNIEGWRSSASRGYIEPLPLVLNGDGWVANEVSYEYSLLGRITRRLTSYRQLIDTERSIDKTIKIQDSVKDGCVHPSHESYQE